MIDIESVEQLKIKHGLTPGDTTTSGSGISKLLQKQVNHEFDNEKLYLTMAFWCDYNGYPETAAFFSEHSLEERKHGMDFVNHMLSRHIKVSAIELESESEDDFKDLEDILKAALKREIETTKLIKKLHSEALTSSDLALTIASKYLLEQLEEEQLFTSILNLYKLCDGNQIDFEMTISKIKEKDRYKLGTI